MTTGMVFNIQRFCIHDGPGIRTTVFLKGCYLRCAWCHNPESIAFEREIMYNEAGCLRCGACAVACGRGGHRVDETGHEYVRDDCVRCLACVRACPAGALEVVGREMTVSEVMAEVVKDRPFYEESGGGMTISGGEPMAQFEFTRELLTVAKAEGIARCVETSGVGPAERFLELVPLADLFLWDIKDTDRERHRRFTGVGADEVRENLRRVDAAGGRTLLRCILIGGHNLDPGHLENIAAIYRELRNCAGVEVLAYHPLGEGKRERLGQTDEHDNGFETPTTEQMAEARVYLTAAGANVLGM